MSLIVDILPDTISNLIIGWIKAGRIQRFCKFLLSLFCTSIITFLFTFGSSIIAMQAQGIEPQYIIMLSIAYACIATAVMVLFLARRFGVPISVSNNVQQELDRVLRDETIVSSGEPDKIQKIKGE